MKLKPIIKKTMEITIINQWLKQDGIDGKICCLTDPALKISLNIFFGHFDEFKKMILRDFDEKIEHKNAIAFYLGLEDKNGTAWHFMNIQKNEWLAEDYGNIVHELHHFVHDALNRKGIKYGEGGEELFAYTQEWFMDLTVRAFLELKKHTDKKKRSRR